MTEKEQVRRRIRKEVEREEEDGDGSEMVRMGKER